MMTCYDDGVECCVHGDHVRGTEETCLLWSGTEVCGWCGHGAEVDD